jgi:hypothetical protein
MPDNRNWPGREPEDTTGRDGIASVAGTRFRHLPENGYETTTAQKKFTEITTMHSDIATTFRGRYDASIEPAKKKIHLALEYARIAREMIKMPKGTRLRTRIDQAYGVMTRSGMVNADLRLRGVDISVTERLIAVGKTHIATARGLLVAGDTREATLELVKFRETVLSLRDAYRAILAREDLPEGSAQGVFSVAQSLELAGSHTGVA